MEQCKQWVLWKLEIKNEKPTKVPYQIDNITKADSTNPKTWSRFRHVRDKSKIGFVFTKNDPFLFIDLDHVLDANGKIIYEWARDIVNSIDSYTEISPSGDGLHVFVIAEMPQEIMHKTVFSNGSKLEVYFSERYSTVTKNIFNGRNNMRKCDVSILKQYAKAKQKNDSIDTIDYHNRKSFLNEQEIISKLEYKGDWLAMRSEDADYSSQDNSLLCSIAFYSNGDSEMIERVFNQHDFSKRDKWKKRSDYRVMSITNAIASCKSFYNPNYHSKGDFFNELDKFVMNKQKREELKNMVYIIDNLIVQGYHTYLFGHAGAGKTTVMLHLCFEMVKNDYTVYFFYLDGEMSTAAKLSEKIEEENLTDKFKILVDGTSEDYSVVLTKLIESNKDLSKKVFVYDTFKWMSKDVNNKNSNKEAMHFIRKLTRLGATFISLGHTNKDGKKHSGTGEVEQDSDALLRIDSIKDHLNKVTSTIKEGGRCRFDVKARSYMFTAGDVNSVEELKDEIIDIEREEKDLLDRKNDVHFIKIVYDLLAKNSYKQEDIYDLLKENTNIKIGKNLIIKKLKKYDGEYWHIEKVGDRNHINLYTQKKNILLPV